MIELDLNDDKSEFTKVVEKRFGPYITCDARRPSVIFHGRLNSIKCIDILEIYLPAAFQKYNTNFP